MGVIDHYPVTFRRAGKPLDRSDIAECERELGVTFPRAYVNLLLAHNGGTPSPAYLPFPGVASKVEQFFSVGDHGLVPVCLRHRQEHGLPQHVVPIAQLADDDCLLVLDCSPKRAGSLFYWSEFELGFRERDEDFDNVTPLHFSIADLLLKFGPAKNRKDPDGMFCQLYYASSSPAQGGKLAAKFVKEGYDINFVPPTFRHPIFGAIDGEAFGVAATLLELGTRANQVDPLHANATVKLRLLEAQKHWQGMLEMSRESDYAAGKGMAMRRLRDIESALAAIPSGRTKAT